MKLLLKENLKVIKICLTVLLHLKKNIPVPHLDTALSTTPILNSESDCDTGSGSTTSTLRQRTRTRTRSAAAAGRTASSNSLLPSAAAGRRTTEDVFAQIILCSESSRDNIGMPKYGHVHLKISQTVCNAIFLCKVNRKNKFKTRN